MSRFIRRIRLNETGVHAAEPTVAGSPVGDAGASATVVATHLSFFSAFVAAVFEDENEHEQEHEHDDQYRNVSAP